jgi:hypothetical protein
MIVEHRLTIVDIAQFERIYARWRWDAFWSVLGAIGFRTAIEHPPVAMVMTSDDGVILWARSFSDPAWSDPYFVDKRQL